MNQPQISIEQFGKDHWSLLAYAHCCVADGSALKPAKMRTNITTHPLVGENCFKWNQDWGTRLHGFFDSRAAELQLSEHDDWDCLEDLEREGLINILSLANAQVELTETGWDISKKLVNHKANGGMFANFSI